MLGAISLSKSSCNGAWSVRVVVKDMHEEDLIDADVHLLQRQREVSEDRHSASGQARQIENKHGG